MSQKRQFVVIGLGRFGGSVCKELIAQGNEVLAMDTDEHKISDFAKIATHAVAADSTDEATLRSLGIRNFDVAVVAIGDNLQASILTTLLLKEIGVTNVWVKAKNSYHQKVLEKIGADKVIHPESDMGRRIAQQLSDENVIDFIELSTDYSIVELIASSKLCGKSLIDLDIRARYGVTVLAIKDEDDIDVSPKPDHKIKAGELLIVIGHNKDIKRFEDEVM